MAKNAHSLFVVVLQTKDLIKDKLKMKQIDSIARLLKNKLCGEYNCYYHSVTIYLDKDDGELYAKFWGQGESYISTPSYLKELVTYNSPYGQWGDDYGCEGNWKLTKKRIARDIQDSINKMEDDDDAYIPEWLEKETEYYLNK